MSRSEAFRTIIVTSDDAEPCRALAANWPGGSGMFQVALCTVGVTEPTHYISTGHIEQSVADMLDNPAQFAAAIGADPEKVQAIRDQMDISTGPYQDALARLGLTLEESE